MKTTKSLIVLLAIISICAFKPVMGQTITRNMYIEVDGINYGPEIGTVTGSYSYHFTFRLSKDGVIESMHFNVNGCDLVNDEGKRILIIDSGKDKLGLTWNFWNKPNISNAGWPITYDVADGWLNEYMPSSMPVEGSYVEMSCRVQFRNAKYDLGGMMQLHMNANGDITAEVKKGWCQGL